MNNTSYMHVCRDVRCGDCFWFGVDMDLKMATYVEKGWFITKYLCPICERDNIVYDDGNPYTNGGFTITTDTE